jgi:hypothetical protein
MCKGAALVTFSHDPVELFLITDRSQQDTMQKEPSRTTVRYSVIQKRNFSSKVLRLCRQRFFLLVFVAERTKEAAVELTEHWVHGHL